MHSIFSGAIPSPLIFGSLLDGVCLKWGERCGQKTSCQIYANEQASYRVIVGILSCKVLAVLFMVLAWKMYRPPQDAVPLDKEGTLEGEVNAAFKVGGLDAPRGEINKGLELEGTSPNGGSVSADYMEYQGQISRL
jgi:hypothetical protein